MTKDSEDVIVSLVVAFAIALGFCVGWKIAPTSKPEPPKVEQFRSPSTDREAIDHYSGDSKFIRLTSQTIEHDGCEYVVFWKGHGICAIHKPDCKRCFPKELQK